MGKQLYLKLVVWIILFSLPIGEAFSIEKVTIYEDADPKLFGQSLSRSGKSEFTLTDFNSTKTVDANGTEGFLTAVVVDASLKNFLDDLFDRFDEVHAGGVWLDNREIGDHNVYRYFDKSMGIDISFYLEKPNAGILRAVESFYQDDDYWGPRVYDHYRENYVIRVFEAEDIIDPWEKEISHQEALLAATILGDVDQWLWGIHNGLGKLFEFKRNFEKNVEEKKYEHLMDI